MRDELSEPRQLALHTHKGRTMVEVCHDPAIKPGRYTALCPCCEGRHTKAISKGGTEDGIPLRSYRCLDCAHVNCPDCADTAHRFGSVETVLPHGLTAEGFDTARRDRAREWWREHNEYLGGTSGSRAAPRYELDVLVRVFDRKRRRFVGTIDERLRPGSWRYATRLARLAEESAA